MAARLTEWYAQALQTGYDPVSPEEGRFINGMITGHADWKDGNSLTTSEVVGRIGDTIITSVGHSYDLGEVDRAYEDIYPDAKNRFLGHVPEIEPPTKG